MGSTLLGEGRRTLQLGAYIDGRQRGTDGVVGRPVEDPATSLVFAHVADATAVQVDDAVAAARRCFDGEWSRWTPAARSQLLARVRALVYRDYDELAALETQEMGAPISRVAFSRPRALGLLDFYAGAALTHRGAYVPHSSPGDITTYVLPEPVGVVAAITPWNAPLNSVIWKIAPAIAVGCTVVVKPSELSPVSALRLAALFTEAGAPDGLVNVLPGAGDVGAALVRHVGVDKVAFTGSTATGQAILRDSVAGLKRVSLELGGKSANIVLGDADLDAAVAGAATAAFANTGQACTAGSRLFLHDSVHDAFLERFVAVAEAMVVGPGSDPATQLGPLVSGAQRQRVQAFIDEATGGGAVLATGGTTPAGVDQRGHFLAPTVVVEAADSSRIAREEVFGPVVTVFRFHDTDDAVRRANALPYGLAAGLWTRDVGTATRVARRLRAGTVWVNCYNRLDPAVPFGGIGMSGFGRESGTEHLDEFVSPKAVWLGG